ncbi:MAG: hypothetical protein U9Q81_04265, partial [Pseudomonadota bacterium]|nr:hypothetical protein [Pseudomonadota bacterium]
MADLGQTGSLEADHFTRKIVVFGIPLVAAGKAMNNPMICELARAVKHNIEEYFETKLNEAFQNDFEIYIQYHSIS